MTEETLWTLNVPCGHISDGITALPRSSHLALADGHPKRPTKQGWLFWGRLLGCLLGLLFVFVVRGVGVVTAHTHDLSCLLPNQKSNKGASADRPVQGSVATPPLVRGAGDGKSSTAGAIRKTAHEEGGVSAPSYPRQPVASWQTGLLGSPSCLDITRDSEQRPNNFFRVQQKHPRRVV